MRAWIAIFKTKDGCVASETIHGNPPRHYKRPCRDALAISQVKVFLGNETPVSNCREYSMRSIEHREGVDLVHYEEDYE